MPVAPLSTVRLAPFELERWQSLHENLVACNLSESGVHPLSVAELLALPGGGQELTGEELLATHLGYPQTNGTEDLRAHIAAMYPGTGVENVLVTHGGAEANFVTAMTVVEPGDEVVVLMPCYMQVPGIVRGLGAEVVPWWLEEERGWRPDLEKLADALTERTRVLVLTNPNNPTGRVLSADELDTIAELCAKRGVWILADEVYRGAELSGEDAPSMWGRCERLFVTSSLSKAYGLPGLRIGWVASPGVEGVERLWSTKDYTSVSAASITMRLACFALEPARRAALIERTRGILRENLAHAVDWMRASGGLLEWTEPDAGAILWCRYDLGMSSLELAEALRVEESVLVVPGEHFGLDRHLRLGYGAERAKLIDGLERTARLLGRCAQGT